MPFSAVQEGDLVWLNGDFKWYEGPVEALRQIASGAWNLWRITGRASGVLISYVEGDKIWVHYLHGRGIGPGEVKEMAEHLRKLKNHLGLRAVACQTQDLRTARLLLATGGRVVNIELELE